MNDISLMHQEFLYLIMRAKGINEILCFVCFRLTSQPSDFTQHSTQIQPLSPTQSQFSSPNIPQTSSPTQPQPTRPTEPLPSNQTESLPSSENTMKRSTSSRQIGRDV